MWCLAHIAEGNSVQCGVLVDFGGVEVLIQLLQSRCLEVLEQAAWGLGNVACDAKKCRDRVVANGGI